MIWLTFNWAGAAMFLGAGAFSLGVQALTGWNDGPTTLLMGACITTVDVAYRLLKVDGDWIATRKGGRILFLPAWCWGTFWIGLGIADTIMCR